MVAKVVPLPALYSKCPEAAVGVVFALFVQLKQTLVDLNNAGQSQSSLSNWMMEND